MATAKIIDKDKTENSQDFIEKQYDYFVDMIRQSQQATIDSFIKLSSILFLLNGSAAAALFSMQRDLYSVIIFACGALMAAGGLLIFYQRCITNTKHWQTRLDHIGIQKN